MRALSTLRTIGTIALLGFGANLAEAGSTSLTLTRTTLTNVDDAAGRTQHQSGNVLRNGIKVGQYLIQRRVTTGGSTAPLNTAATTIALFMATAGGTAPQNITLQGAHDFGPGNFRGSVSGASNRYTWLQGADATYSSSNTNLTLIFNWTGASQLSLP